MFLRIEPVTSMLFVFLIVSLGMSDPASALPKTPRDPTPPVTTRKAPPGASVITILDLSGQKGVTNGDRLGLQHALDAFGIPYRITNNLQKAVKAPEMLIVAWNLSPDLPPALLTQLRNALAGWSQRSGRTLWLAGASDAELLKTLGIVQNGSSSTTRSVLRLNNKHPLASYVDAPEEHEVWLASTNTNQYVLTRAYAPLAKSAWSNSVLGRYPDGRIGALTIRHRTGGGRVVLIGVKWKDLLTRMENQKHGDHTRGGTNVFEPSTDTVRLWLRAGYQQWAGHPSLRPRAPNGKKAAVLLTHDIDARSAFLPLRDSFIPLETSLGMRSTLMVTTSYRRNGWITDFYSDANHHVILAKALAKGFEVQSHSVSHLPDMDSWRPGPALERPKNYAPNYNKTTSKTTGGYVLPELLISARLLEQDFGIGIRGWRSGHLLRPRGLGELLEASGYAWDSSHNSGRVGGSYPYLMLSDFAIQGRETPVLTLPLAISDSRIETRTATKTAALWLDVTRKNAANGAPTVLLVHPTKPEIKLPALKLYLKAIKKDPNLWVGPVDAWYTWYRKQGIRSQQP